jgi:recombination endonuclease VII
LAEREHHRRYYSEDPARGIAYSRSYQKRHPDRIAEYIRTHPRRFETLQGYQRKTRYGLTPERHAEMFAAQKGLCAICDAPEESRDANRRVRALCVDHDHVTGQVRGLLCARCNSVLGFIENERLMTAATAYLRRTAQEEVA